MVAKAPSLGGQTTPKPARRVGRWTVYWLVTGCLVVAGVIGFLVGSLRSPATATLVLGTPIKVTVARYAAGPVGGPAPNNQTPDSVITVTSGNQIAKLVADANSLPLFPKGTVNCPAGDGSHYQLQFSYSNGDRQTLLAERQSCRGVGFADRPDRFIASSATDSRLLDDLDSLFR